MRSLTGIGSSAWKRQITSKWVTKPSGSAQGSALPPKTAMDSYDRSVDAPKTGAASKPSSRSAEKVEPEKVISQLYQELLLREPDAEGLEAYTGAWERLSKEGLEPAEIEAVLAGYIQQSDEFRAVEIVEKVFQEELDRPAERNGWHDLALEMVWAGRSDADIEVVIRGHVRRSDEWKKLHPGESPSKGAQTWVGLVPELDQRYPDGADGNYWNGNANCGPTSAAMVARALGYRDDLNDAELIMLMYELCGTDGADGTNAVELALGLQAMGLQTQTKWVSTDVELMAAQLEDGNIIIANGDYYALGVPGRANVGNQGHYIVVEGLDDHGNFIVNDPWDGLQHVVEPWQMERFLAEWPNDLGKVGGNWIAAKP